MKKNSITIILLLLISFSYSQEKNFIDQNYIEVIGKVEKEIEPNEIYINIFLNENDFKKGVKVEDKEIEMVNALNSLDIDTKNNLRIKSFNGVFEHYFFKKNTVIKQKTYQLLVTKKEILSELFQILDILKISNVSITKVDHSNIEELKFELKAKAIQISKKKAKSYANAIDQSIGKALFIEEINNTNYNNNSYSNSNTILQEVVIRGYSPSNKKREFPKLSLQKIKISASVKVKFELK